MIRTEFSNGVIETRNYDKLNRLIYLENKRGGTVISSYDYTLDRVGNRLKVEGADGRVMEYGYDDLYRLTSERITDLTDSTNNGRVIGYTYDPVGNRLTQTDSVEGVTTYTYDKNDRLLSETLNGEVTVYEYDDNGNTLSRQQGNQETVYKWNDENCLLKVILASELLRNS